MTPLTALETEDAVVNSTSSSVTTPPPTRRRRWAQLMIDLKDTLLLRIRSRNISARERHALHKEIASDPEAERAVERILAANPHLRRKAHDQGAISDKHG